MNPETPSGYDHQNPTQPQVTNGATQNRVVQVEEKGKPWAATVAVVAAAVSLLMLLPFVFYSLTVASNPSVAPFAYLFFVLVPVAFVVVPTTAIAAMIMAAIAKPNASKRTKTLLLITQVILTLDALAAFLIFYN
jgi:hypothetical protein